MNIRWNIILGVIALALLGWYYSLNQDHSDLQSLIKKPDSPEYVGNKMQTTVFSNHSSQKHIDRSCHIQTEFIKNLLILIFDFLIRSDVQICC